ncbi:hypothetical protein V0288_12995 [Pannus brasiliensis CCIBt3594]|uniref:Uncharacterized protein n=1 Tax=Pannus brasiliensis CCIBt3594 TaxID=1427578 RepID=A0AAW9QVA3_9CHRO
MKVWIVTSVLLFILVQIYQSLKGYILPLPIYVLAGALLAIASNASGKVEFLSGQTEQQIATTIDLPETLPSQPEMSSLPAIESETESVDRLS